MEYDTWKEKIQTVLTEVLKTYNVQEFDYSDNLEETGMDSLDVVEVIMEMEEQLGVDVPDTPVSTFQDFVDLFYKAK